MREVAAGPPQRDWWLIFDRARRASRRKATTKQTCGVFWGGDSGHELGRSSVTDTGTFRLPRTAPAAACSCTHHDEHGVAHEGPASSGEEEAETLVGGGGKLEAA